MKVDYLSRVRGYSKLHYVINQKQSLKNILGAVPLHKTLAQKIQFEQMFFESMICKDCGGPRWICGADYESLILFN